MKKNMARQLGTSSGIQVYSSNVEALGQDAQGLADEIWNNLSEPTLAGAIEELKGRELKKELHKAVLVVLVRKSTENRVAKMRAARFDASEVIKSLNEAIEANRPDWEEKVA